MKLYYKVQNFNKKRHLDKRRFRNITKMSEKQQLQRQFNQIRKNYPQKLTQLTVKQSLLLQCIQKMYFPQFQTIFNKSVKNNQNKGKENRKVLDETDVKQNQTKTLDSNLLEAIKIIVKAYEKNTSINQIYNFQIVQQMVEKTKITLKDLISTSSQNLKPRTSQKIQSEKVKQQNIKQKPIAFNDKVQPPAPAKPKSNSLFVQKQAPISQNNIFKDLFKGQNTQIRPSSRLLSQNIQNNIMPEKPRSSARSNRSKRSRVSSRGPSNEKLGIDENDKKSQKRSESGLREEVLQKSIEIKVQKKKSFDISSQKHVPSQEAQEIVSNQDAQEMQNQPVQQEQPVSSKSQPKKIIFNSNNDQIHLPTFKLSTQRPIKRKSPIDSILTNPFIKKTFSHLCKQSYIGGGKTFDQIAQSADIMTLNKWMVFCKEFDFLSKLKKKQLVDIFQQTTSNKPQMNQQQFLDALIILQNKLKVDEEDFIRKSMCLDSEFAFRQKVATFKINYSGPKQNFFEEATIKPLDKYYQNLRQAKYQQERKKQKQIILFQGKFKQQIENELLDRKNQRQLKKSHLINSMMFDKLTKNNKISLSTSIDTKNVQNQFIKSPYLNYLQKKMNTKGNDSSFNRYDDLENSKLKISRRIDPITYTEIFSQKNSNHERAVTTDKKDSKILTQKTKIKSAKNDSQFITDQPRATTQLSKIKPKNNQETTKIKNRQTTQRKPEKAQQEKPKRQWVEQIKNWSREYDKSESQESDDILREHLKGEKIRNTPLPQKIQLSRIMEHYKNDSKWLQHNDNQDQHSQWDRETQLQTTIKKQRFK